MKGKRYRVKLLTGGDSFLVRISPFSKNLRNVYVHTTNLNQYTKKDLIFLEDETIDDIMNMI